MARTSGSVGKAQRGSTVVVRNEGGEEAAPGEVGTVWFKRSEIEPFEYHRDPEKTASVHDGNLFTLGDMATWTRTATSSSRPHGRADHLRRRQHLPAEIDAVLLEHPAVRDVACVGIPTKSGARR